MSVPWVLVNAGAGGGRAGASWARWREEAARLTKFREESPADREGAVRLVREAAESGCQRLVVWGGDGTIHLVVNALLEMDAGSALTLGLVPAGTGCDLLRAVAVPRDPGAALHRALFGPPQRCDAGRCSTVGRRFFFANIASAGVSGMVDERVNAIAGRGALAFLRATLQAIGRYRAVDVEVEVDGAPFFSGPLFLLAVANGTTFGKGMRVAPGAVVDDGLFDVVTVGRVGRLELWRRIPQLYLGRHLGARPVRHTRARTVRLRPSGELPPFDADGETHPSGDAELTILPSALRVAGPLEVRTTGDVRRETK